VSEAKYSANEMGYCQYKRRPIFITGNGKPAVLGLIYKGNPMTIMPVVGHEPRVLSLAANLSSENNIFLIHKILAA
jgi:hypothetical protein